MSRTALVTLGIAVLITLVLRVSVDLHLGLA